MISAPMHVCPCDKPARLSAAERIRRWTLVAAGCACVALGALGVVVPGLPTTIFLIVASWCFVRSCPWMERKLVRSRLFAPYAPYLDGSRHMPARAKAITIAIMAAFTGASCIVLLRSPAPIWAPLTVAALAIVGAAFIIRWRPTPAPQSSTIAP